MTKQDYLSDMSIAIDEEDYEEVNILINLAYRDTGITPDIYASITNFAKNRGFKFGEHYQLLEV